MSNDSFLAIETSVANGSVALWQEGGIVLERTFLAGRKPSATLWPALEEVMGEVKNLDAIIVGIGPGSYNGSRIGIAAAQGIAMVHNCGVAPLCSFEGVTPATENALAIGDARRKSFSLQKVVRGRIEGEFSLVESEELSTRIHECAQEGTEVFSFDPPERFPISNELQAVIQFRQSQAGKLAKSFAERPSSERATLTATPAEPFYLRDPHITIGKRKSLLER
ncbi:MAG: tRNA (adenosine(37)-N6)-threonylcarbamoyltransferase complex dimerization subunit type 1 TsaB [Roseibacillus sp.]